MKGKLEDSICSYVVNSFITPGKWYFADNTGCAVLVASQNGQAASLE